MELTPEERNRIYLEEKARLDVLQAQKVQARNKTRTRTSRWSDLLMVGFAILLAVLVMLVINAYKSHNGTLSSASAPSASTTGNTKLTCYCATSYDSVVPLFRAYASSDASALYGLISRAKAIQLNEGTRVHVLDSDNGVAAVLVESGFHSGERCWIWEKFIAR